MEQHLNEKLSEISPKKLNLEVIRNQIDEEFHQVRLNLLRKINTETFCEKFINKILLNKI